MSLYASTSSASKGLKPPPLWGAQENPTGKEEAGHVQTGSAPDLHVQAQPSSDAQLTSAQGGGLPSDLTSQEVTIQVDDDVPLNKLAELPSLPRF